MTIQSKLSIALAALTLAAAPITVQAETLPKNVVDAIELALDDEYHAEAIYAEVLAKHGDVRPFSNIINAEQRHSSALVNLLENYKLAVPQNAYENGTKPIDTLPASLQAACAVGVEAEIANIRLYDEKLIPVASSYPDVLNVFTNLRNASEDKHLPAFQRCGSGKGQGMGKGHGMGNGQGKGKGQGKQKSY